jgi:hypothetical protein
MHPDRIKVVIAESDGWVPNGAGYWHKGKESRSLHYQSFDDCGGIGPDHTNGLPDYPTDLNASLPLLNKLPSLGITAHMSTAAPPKIWLLIAYVPYENRFVEVEVTNAKPHALSLAVCEFYLRCLGKWEV